MEGHEFDEYPGERCPHDGSLVKAIEVDVEEFIFETDPPTLKREKILINLVAELFQHAGKVGEILCNFYILFEDEDNHTKIIKPDIAFVSFEKKDIIKNNGLIVGAPDIVVEIIPFSPTSLDTLFERREIIEIYEKLGVEEYWMVYPDNKEILIFENGIEGFRILCMGRGSECISKIIEDFKFNFIK